MKNRKYEPVSEMARTELYVCYMQLIYGQTHSWRADAETQTATNTVFDNKGRLQLAAWPANNRQH